MEIITIPLQGSLKHADNIGNEKINTAGEVQVMSAGKGLMHSEFNASDAEPVRFFRYGFSPINPGLNHVMNKNGFQGRIEKNIGR